MDSKNKNILIGGLLAIVLVMAVGYAAFATTLNITGTATIDSNWKVEITKIEMTDHQSATTGDLAAGNVAGEDTENPLPSFTATTATFKSKLVTPGDYVEYTVTVKNSGNVNAHLKEIKWADAANAAATPIVFTKGSEANITDLAAGATGTITVRVTYDAATTTQPGADDLSKTETLVLDYEQASA